MQYPFLEPSLIYAQEFIEALKKPGISHVFDPSHRETWSANLTRLCQAVDGLAGAIHRDVKIKPPASAQTLLSQLINITDLINDISDEDLSPFGEEILTRVGAATDRLVEESHRQPEVNRNAPAQPQATTNTKTKFVGLAALGILTAITGNLRLWMNPISPTESIDMPAQVSTTDVNTDTFLFAAMNKPGNYTDPTLFTTPDTTTVKAHLAFSNPDNINKRFSNGLTLLQVAVRNNRPDLVRIILNHGAAESITAAIPGQLSPWQEAIAHGQYAIVKQFMQVLPELSLTVNQPDAFGITDIQRASRTGDPDLMQLLLAASPSVELVGNRDAYAPKNALNALREPADIQKILAAIPVEHVATPVCVTQNFGNAMVRLRDGSMITLENMDGRTVFDYIQHQRFGITTTEGYNELTAYLNPGHAFLRLQCQNCDEGEHHDANIGFYPAGRSFKPTTVTVETTSPPPETPQEVAQGANKTSRLYQATQIASYMTTLGLSIATNVTQAVVGSIGGRIREELSQIPAHARASMDTAKFVGSVTTRLTQAIVTSTLQHLQEELTKIPENALGSLDTAKLVASITGQVTEALMKSTARQIHEVLSDIPDSVQASMDSAKWVGSLTTQVAEAVLKSTLQHVREELSKIPDNIQASMNSAYLVARVTAYVTQEVMDSTLGLIHDEGVQLIPVAQFAAGITADIAGAVLQATLHHIQEELSQIPENMQASVDTAKLVAGVTADISQAIAESTLRHIQQELEQLPGNAKASMVTAKLVATVTTEIAQVIGKAVLHHIQEELAQIPENARGSLNTARLIASVTADVTQAIMESTLHRIQEELSQIPGNAGASLNTAKLIVSVTADVTHAITASTLHRIQEELSQIPDNAQASLDTAKLVATLTAEITQALATSTLHRIQEELSQIPDNAQASLDTAKLVATLTADMTQAIVDAANPRIREELSKIPENTRASLDTAKIVTTVITAITQAVVSSTLQRLQENLSQIPENTRASMNSAKLIASLTMNFASIGAEAAEKASLILLNGLKVSASGIAAAAGGTAYVAGRSVELLSPFTETAVQLKKGAGKVKRTVGEYYRSLIVDNYVMLKNQQGRVANEDDYEAMSHRENLLKLTFYVENGAAQQALQRINTVTAACAGEGSPEDCRYYLFSKNCVDFVQEVYRSTGAGGHIGDYLLASQMRRQDIGSLGKLFQYKAVNYAAISSVGLKKFIFNAVSDTENVHSASANLLLALSSYLP